VSKMWRRIVAIASITAVLALCLLSRSPSLILQLPRQTDGELAEYDGSLTGDQVQAMRKAAVRTECLNHAGHGVMTPMNPFFASKFFPASLTLAEEEGLAWCRVGKVGTTAWSILFLLLRDVPPDQIAKAVIDLTAHDLLKQKFPSRPSERMHMVKGEHGVDYFKFMVVRHPFIRIVSAFRDKLETLAEHNVRYHMRDAPRMTSRRTFNSSVADSPTFPEFVEYLIRTPPNLMDKHWAPYSKVCLPCNISYSAILRLETLQLDADWLFPRLGLEKLRRPWEQVAGGAAGVVKVDKESGEETVRVHGGPGGEGGASSASLMEKYFSQLEKSAIVRLYEKYSVDFRMFGYDSQVQKYINMGW